MGPKGIEMVKDIEKQAWYGSLGRYFAKKSYEDEPLLDFAMARRKLPEPICSGRPDYIEGYWKAWEIAYRNAYVPNPASGFVSNFVDAAFNSSIFLWDTVFITMFCNLGHPYIPGIRSLDNFYCKQFDDGEIPREIVRDTGEPFDRWLNWRRKPLHSYFHNHYRYRGLFSIDPPNYEEMHKPDLGRTVEEPPYLTLDALNHPLPAWAELESLRHTGDTGRLKLVWEPLYRYYRALHHHLRNRFGLFVTDWASMDNSPRNRYLGSGVDISCEMALFARQLTEMAGILAELYEREGDGQRVRELREAQAELAEDARNISAAVNDYMWDPASGFYYDVMEDGQLAPVKTIAAYWALLSGVADEAQAASLVRWLENPAAFARKHRVPTLAADEEGYQPAGGYWQGAVWAPTNTMVVRGLEKYGYHQLARDIAVEHLDRVTQVYRETGTFWENYAADFVAQGDKGKPDFVGWSGIGPILFLLEHAIGLKGDALRNVLRWRLNPALGESGCRRYWFNGRTVDLRAVPEGDGFEVTAESDGPLTLRIEYGGREVSVDLMPGKPCKVRL
jgi:glycogen debranching enzyme